MGYPIVMNTVANINKLISKMLDLGVHAAINRLVDANNFDGFIWL
jgi:hypothetical protein